MLGPTIIATAATLPVIHELETPAEHTAPDALDQEMRQWVERTVGKGGSVVRRARRLTTAVLSPSGLGLRQIVGPTLPAQEAFRLRRANCVSLAHLLVALGGEIDLPLDLAISGGQSKPQRSRAVSISYGHLVAVLRAKKPMIIDFGGMTATNLEALQLISGAEARAIYYSNLGAEALLRQHPHEAYGWLELAIRLGPRLTSTWLNLGVALRRSGNAAEAMAAYRRALELDGDDRFAARNLEILTGRNESISRQQK